MAENRSALRSLSTQMIASFAAIVGIATLLSGIPAYWIIRSALESQLDGRLGGAVKTTSVFLDLSLNQVADAARLTAERPTLRRALDDEDTASLQGYLDTLRIGADVDSLAVIDADGTLSAAGGAIPADLFAGLDPGGEYVVLSDPSTALALAAKHDIVDTGTGRHLGSVLALTRVDDAFMRGLSEGTGVEQSIVIAGKRVASSLPGAVGMAVDAASEAGPGETVEFETAGGQFRAESLPLKDTRGEVLAYAEIALSIGETRLAEQRALLAIAASALVIGLGGSLLGAGLARKVAGPIEVLTRAADQLSRGTLDKPVPVRDGPSELVTLSSALESSRLHLRRTLDELTSANAWSENLIQSIVEGVITVDPLGTVEFISRGAERLTGWTPEEAVGLPLDLVLRPVEPESMAWIWSLPAEGSKRQVRVFNQAGREVSLAITAARLKLPADGEAQIALVLRDVTEEEAVRELRSYFLANISHEFKTPLSALTASIELLMDEADKFSSEDVGALLASIHVSSLGLQTLVDNLLESTSIEAGRFGIRTRPTQMRLVIEDALRVIRPLMERRQQTFRVISEDKIPVVEADPTRLTQVFVNLLSNACKYSPLGAEIEVHQSVKDGWLRTEVADRGPGIALTERRTLFQRFVRLRRQDEAQYGIGLGLSVVKAIVEGHGGAVGVEGREGGGSIFWFTLPLYKDQT
jgi:two-component system phosphate regulon sensor histidine kinase PhoR